MPDRKSNIHKYQKPSPRNESKPRVTTTYMPPFHLASAKHEPVILKPFSFDSLPINFTVCGAGMFCWSDLWNLFWTTFGGATQPDSRDWQAKRSK